MVSQDVITKLEMLSADDYRMVVALIDRLAEKPSNMLGDARNKHVKNNPVAMEEIDREIEVGKGERVTSKMQAFQRLEVLRKQKVQEGLDGLNILNSFVGILPEDFDYDKELEEALEEKYGK